MQGALHFGTVSSATLDPASDSRPTAIQERYALRIKQRLAQPRLELRDARDGILDCFVATYHAGVANGLESILGIRGSETEVGRVTTAIFRRRLSTHGVTFEAPTVDALAAVKAECDDELHIAELPSELRAIHDQVCALLLAKVDGLLGHTGDRSAVRTAPPPDGAPVRTAPPLPPMSAATPAAAAPRPQSTPEDRAKAELRRTLALWLREVGERAQQGADPSALARDLARASQLLAALTAFGDAL